MADADRPSVVDIMSCELIGEMLVDVKRTIHSNFRLENMSPIIFSVSIMKTEVILQIHLQYKEEMIEACLEVLSAGPIKELKFKIKYGIESFVEYQSRPQMFTFNESNAKSEYIPVCKFNDLIDFMLANVTGQYQVDFISNITISLRYGPAPLPQHSIPTVNSKDGDHTLVCGNHEIVVHKHIVMAASKFFHQRFQEQPHFTRTVIGRLEDEAKRIRLDVLTVLLRFMYGLYISPSNLLTVELLGAAREFGVTKLFEICQDRMIKDLTPGRAPELLYIGISEKAPKLKVAAAKYITANYKAVRDRYEWSAIQKVFPEVFDLIVPNPLRFMREIVHPGVRSKSTDDIITNVWFKQTSPSFQIPTVPRDTSDVRDTKDPEDGNDKRKDSSTDSSQRGSEATLVDAESLSYDMVTPRQRSSPVTNRRLRSVSLSIGAYDWKPLAKTLPRPTFSRETLKKKLLANISKFDDTFGPVASTASSSTTTLSRSMSTRDEYRSNRTLSTDIDLDSKGSGSLKLQYYKYDSPMDSREDSCLTEAPEVSRNVDPNANRVNLGNQGNQADVSSDDLFYPSLQFSYDSKVSVFERSEPKPVVPTPAEQMSVSEIPSQVIVGPTAMASLDFQRFAHPEALTLSDVSSLPQDPSSTEQPLSTPSSKSKAKSRRAKRMQKKAEKSRKSYPPPTSSTPSTTSTPSIPSSPTGLIPRPTFSKAKSTKEKQQQQPGKTASEKITLGGSETVPKIVESEELGDSERMQMKSYEHWLDTATTSNIPGVFQETSSSHAKQLGECSGETYFREKHLDELERKLHLNVSDESKPSAGEAGKDKRRPLEYKKLEKSSPTSSSGSTDQQFPVGGGVIKKTAGRFKMHSVDSPQPLSSTESIATTTSGLSSSEEIKFKKPTPKSFVNLRTIRHSSTEEKSEEKKERKTEVAEKSTSSTEPKRKSESDDH